MTEMTQNISPGDSLAQLAATRAGAARVFHRHHLDFCCGGHTDLATACATKGLDPAAVLAEIAAESPRDEEFERWDECAPGELIEHILTRYHAPHRAEIVRLHGMARKVETVHRDKASCPRGLAALLERMSGELEQHMAKEEQVLFPLIRSGAGRRAQAPIQVMEAEHKDHAANLARLDALTNGYAAPADACGTWRALYLGLAEFKQQLMQHIHLENNVLFPRALRG